MKTKVLLCSLILLMASGSLFAHDLSGAYLHPNIPAAKEVEVADPGQVNTFCASNLSCTVTAGWTFSSSLTISGTQTNTGGVAISTLPLTDSADALFSSGRPWYDVMGPGCGAKNDGATDDTAAIQACIAKANVTGGIVYFPPATTANKFYKVSSNCSTSPFIISGNSVEIKGAAWYGSFSGAVNLPSQIFAGSCNGDLFSVNSGVQGFALDGLQLTGPCGSVGTCSLTSSRAINLGPSPQTAYIHENSILDWGLSAIFSSGGSTVIVYNNYCINNLFARPSVDTGVLDLASTDNQVLLGYYSASVPTGAGNLGNGHSYSVVIRGGNSHITSVQAEQSMNGILLTSGGSFTTITNSRATTNQGSGLVINSVGNLVSNFKCLSNGLNATNTVDCITVSAGDNVFTNNECNNSGGFANLERHCITDSNSTGTAQANENQYSNNRADSTGIAGVLYNMTGTSPYRIHHPDESSADQGDTSPTIQCWLNPSTIYFNTALTANRTVTLSTTGAWNGCKFRVVRTASATGAFSLTANSLVLNPGNFADFEFIAGAWKTVAPNNPLTIASGTQALNTASITTLTCDAGVAATANGVLSTDKVSWSFNAAPTATDKYGAFLQVYAVPSANTVTFYTCNPSATTSTPTAMSVNWSVERP